MCTDTKMLVLMPSSVIVCLQFVMQAGLVQLFRLLRLQQPSRPPESSPEALRSHTAGQTCNLRRDSGLTLVFLRKAMPSDDDEEEAAELFSCGICEDLMIVPTTPRVTTARVHKLSTAWHALLIHPRLVCCGRSFCKDCLQPSGVQHFFLFISVW